MQTRRNFDDYLLHNCYLATSPPPPTQATTCASNFLGGLLPAGLFFVFHFSLPRSGLKSFISYPHFRTFNLITTFNLTIDTKRELEMNNCLPLVIDSRSDFKYSTIIVVVFVKQYPRHRYIQILSEAFKKDTSPKAQIKAYFFYCVMAKTPKD